MNGAQHIVSALEEIVGERTSLEATLQNVKGELSDQQSDGFEKTYDGLQRRLASLFKSASDDQERISIMLEMVRILENRLVYLQNFAIDPTSDNRVLATLVTQFIDQLVSSGNPVLTSLESTYYRAVARLFAGELDKAREGFRAACSSEESDEANDIKYKSYVILGNLSHEAHEYSEAREMHDQSLRYSQNRNVTAQAVAFKALNAYALQDYDEALALFEESLELFDRNEPFFNSYFYRNALLFSASIYFDRKNYVNAEKYYRIVAGYVEQSSYDYFDALSQLGRICYATGRFDEAASSFRDAIQTHKVSENEYLVDTYFWLAKTHLRKNEPAEAKLYLEKITSSEVKYVRKSQAEELLRKVS